MSYIQKRLASFSYALQGILQMLKSEPNSRIHLLATIAAVTIGAFLGINRIEWAIIAFAISSVWICELFNSSIEALSDKISPEKDPFIKKAKDFGAAATLLAAVFALVAGALIFLPKLFL
ncbi:diacylglycerol kinase [Ekhidna sp.]